MGHFHSAANDPLCSKAFENVQDSVPKDEVNHGPKLQICHKKGKNQNIRGGRGVLFIRAEFQNI